MAETTLQRHPIRGALWGLSLGLGLGLLLMVLAVLQLSIPILIVFAVGFTVLGGLWGAFAPPKKAKGPAPGAAPQTTSAPGEADEPPRAEE